MFTPKKDMKGEEEEEEGMCVISMFEVVQTHKRDGFCDSCE